MDCTLNRVHGARRGGSDEVTGRPCHHERGMLCGSLHALAQCITSCEGKLVL